MTATLERALAALRGGGLVIVPTETVYGLAADARNPEAVARIYAAKGRPRFNPLIAHVAGIEHAARVGRLDAQAMALAEAFWPGPLTLVVPPGPQGDVCDLARAGLDSVALRTPDHPLMRALLTEFGAALAAPSANRSGRPSPTRFADAVAETGSQAAAALDGGDCRIGLESTVVSLMQGAPRLLRPGGVTRDALEAVIGPLAADDGDGHRSPGRLALHYAPDAPVRLDAEAPLPGEAYLAFGPTDITGPLVWILSANGDLGEAAARLFTLLREADRRRPVAIAVAPVPDRGLGEAINDRLRRAAGHIG